MLKCLAIVAGLSSMFLSGAGCAPVGGPEEGEGENATSIAQALVNQPLFFLAPGGDFSNAYYRTTMPYVTWDGSQWIAQLKPDGQTFLHAPDGDFSRAHSDTVINYKTWDGGEWQAKIVDGYFIHAPSGDYSRAHSDTILNYIDWDHAPWTNRLETGVQIKRIENTELGLSVNNYPIPVDGLLLYPTSTVREWILWKDQTIRPRAKQTLCLSHRDPEQVVLTDCFGSGRQQWFFRPDGAIQNALVPKVLTAQPSFTSYRLVLQSATPLLTLQKWRLVN